MFARHFFVGLFLSLSALVSACQSPGSGYLMNGIGAELPARDIASARRTQNAYFNYLCQQAGLTDGSFSDKPGNCQIQALDEGSWTLIVKQGMNDIDRRCDAYLQWLDNLGRSRGPLLQQVSDTEKTVSAIMFAIDPGSAAALQIVGQAFGLITKSINNYHSRLLLEIEPSTRNSVVLNALRDFRNQTRSLRFSNRPDAEYALREYMRRCLPFAIESQINDLSTLGSQGVSPGSARTIFEAPVSFQRPVVVAPPREALKPSDHFGTKSERPDFSMDSRLTKVFASNGYQEKDLIKLQRVFCVSESGFDQIGPQTLAGVVIFEATPWSFARQIKDGKVSEAEWRILSNIPDCDTSTFKNFYERLRLDTNSEMKGFIAGLNDWLPDSPLEKTALLSSAEVRSKIAEARKLFKLSDMGGTAQEQVTADLLAELQRIPPEPEAQQ